jgi:hypothetical protein
MKKNIIEKEDYLTGFLPRLVLEGYNFFIKTYEVISPLMYTLAALFVFRFYLQGFIFNLFSLIMVVSVIAFSSRIILKKWLIDSNIV